MYSDIVIIGGGVAAVSAIKAIREVNSDVSILVIQKEPAYPYYRIRLTKSLFENTDVDKILIQKKEWYETNHVNILLGKEVTIVEPKNNKLILNDGTDITYDKLLLANGSTNFIPPIEGIYKEHVHTIRTFHDVQDIKQDTVDKKKILLIGGGIQNIEAAWAFSSHDKNVIIVEFMDKLMPRQLDDRASEILKNAVEASNVKILLGTSVENICGNHEVKGVITQNGDHIDCEMILYSVGIRANKKLFENTELQINNGVVIDEQMHTNIENIYAAGDIAELNGRVAGLWSVSMEQGKTAGYNMVGKTTSYVNSLPVTTLNAFNLSIFSVGNIEKDSCSISLTEDPHDEKNYKRIFIHDNKIIGAIVIGGMKYNNLLKRYVEGKTDISTIDFSNLSVNEFLQQLK